MLQNKSKAILVVLHLFWRWLQASTCSSTSQYLHILVEKRLMEKSNYLYSTKDIQHIGYCWGSPYCRRAISSYLNIFYFLKQTRREGNYLRTCIFNYKVRLKDIATSILFRKSNISVSQFYSWKGHLQLCVMLNVGEADTREWCIELFRMDGYKDWTKVLSYRWIPCMKIGPVKVYLIIYIKPIHLMRNGSSHVLRLCI